MQRIILCAFAVAFLITASFSAKAQFGGGSGTELYPYLIEDINHLEALADSVNGDRTALWNSRHYKLTADITDSLRKPIGIRTTALLRPFCGSFDGNGYLICLAIDNSNTDLFYVGAFGYVTNGEIKNLTVCGYVNHNKAMGNNVAGGIVGSGWSFSSHSYKFKITNCINMADVNGYDAGGIVGAMADGFTIENCINVGNITGYHAGGFIGCSYSAGFTINECANYGYIKGNIVGGFATENSYPTRKFNGIIQNSINTGVVEGNANFTGAILGGSNYPLNNITTITNCHYDGQMCIYSGINIQVDVAGQIDAHLTRNMVGDKLSSLLGTTNWTFVGDDTDPITERLYPQIKSLDHTEASLVGASPIFLFPGDD